MKKNVTAGLNGLLNPTISAQDTRQDQETPAPGKRGGRNFKVVSYSITPELDEKMRYIAYYDRKRINAVVTEAFNAYISNWKPAPQEKPKKL